MKKACLLCIILIITKVRSFSQHSNEILALRLGYSSTNIVFKEAFEPSLNFFGVIIKSGKAFTGDGPELGVSKSINNKIFIEFAFSTFNGNNIQAQQNNDEYNYTLKGFSIPLTANYFIRKPEKKLRFTLGSGVQYLQAHMQQYEKITNGNYQIINQLRDIHIEELQMVFRPGIQFRIIPNLFATFYAPISISFNGRYTDHPCFSLKYSFRKLNVKQLVN